MPKTRPRDTVNIHEKENHAVNAQHLKHSRTNPLTIAIPMLLVSSAAAGPHTVHPRMRPEIRFDRSSTKQTFVCRSKDSISARSDPWFGIGIDYYVMLLNRIEYIKGHWLRCPINEDCDRIGNVTRALVDVPHQCKLRRTGRATVGTWKQETLLATECGIDLGGNGGARVNNVTEWPTRKPPGAVYQWPKWFPREL